MQSKRVEVSVVTIEPLENAPHIPTFEEIINSCAPGQLSSTTEIKLYNLSINDCLFGMIEKIQSKNIAPEKNMHSGETNPLPIANDAGLVYGNSFLYSISLKVLLYEVNKNGLFLDRLIETIQALWNTNHNDWPIKIHVAQVLKSDAYEKIAQINNITSLEIEVANPRGILSTISSNQDKLLKALKTLTEDGYLDSDVICITQKIFRDRIRGNSLDQETVRSFLEKYRTLFGPEIRGHFNEIKVSGYIQDAESEHTKTEVDLIANSFKLYIKLPDHRLLSDLQVIDRKNEMERLFNENLSEFRRILIRS